MLKTRKHVWKPAAKLSQEQIRHANEGVAKLQWGESDDSQGLTRPPPVAAPPPAHPATGIPEIWEESVYQDIDYIVIRKVQVSSLHHVFGTLTCMQFR